MNKKSWGGNDKSTESFETFIYRVGLTTTIDKDDFLLIPFLRRASTFTETVCRSSYIEYRIVCQVINLLE